MRRVLLSTISLVALSAGGALAADIPRPGPVYRAPVAVQMYNWTGGYIGINGGYGFGNSDILGFEADPRGGLVGLTLGYNWQAFGSPWVFGLEGDINWSNIKGSFTSLACPLGCEIKNEWFGTARGRLGYAMDRFMPYVTGGLAFGDVGATVNGVATTSDTNFGWTVGAGIEGALAPELDCQDRISLHGSRQHELRRGCLRRLRKQHRLHHTHRARRLELQVLIGTSRKQQSPGRKSGAFAF